MSLYQASQDDLSLMLSAATGQTITSSMYTVQGVRSTTTTEQAGVANGRNSKARVLMNGSASWRGYVDVYYDRLDLSALTNFSPIKIATSIGLDLFSVTVMNAIRDMYGIIYTTADFADASTVDDGSGNAIITLTALPQSVGWINSVTIGFAGLPNIATAFSSPVLPGF
jgi:hypothetical protein